MTEYYSQVKGQETALNKLTADQYKAARDAFNNNGRNPNSAKEQRQVHKDLEADIAKNLFDQYTTKRGMEPDAALKLAKKDAAKIRKSQKLAALHEPDNIAGGFFGVPEDVGKSNVNSAIGSAWKSRVGYIDQYVDQAIAAGNGSKYLNLNLTVNGKN